MRRRFLLSRRCFEDSVDINFHVHIRVLPILCTNVLCSLEPRFAHGSSIILLCIGVKRTVSARLMLAFEYSTKMLVVVDQLVADIADFGSATTGNLVAAAILDERL